MGRLFPEGEITKQHAQKRQCTGYIQGRHRHATHWLNSVHEIISPHLSLIFPIDTIWSLLN